MTIDMSNYKLIHNDRVYNCLSIVVFYNDLEVEQLEVFYINEENRVALLRGDSSEFQFISK